MINARMTSLMLGSLFCVAATVSHAQPPRRGGGDRGDMTPEQVEQQMRNAISRRLRNETRLPDSVINRVTTIAFRYRDSAFVLRDQERYVLREMSQEARAARDTTANQARIDCLMGAFWRLQQQRLDIRVSEQRDLNFLAPLDRLRYLSVQELVDDVIDDNMDRLIAARGALAGGARGPPPGGRRGGGRRGDRPPPRTYPICPATPG